MRGAILLFLVAACDSPAASSGPDAATPTPDAADPDSPPAAAGFGDLTGMCGVLDAMDATSTSPELLRGTFTFARQFVDPDDRGLLTPGGLRLAELPNAGGSSKMSEVFAYEQLARCDQATLLKTELEIVYDTQGKITDLEISLDGHKIGVSVTRAVTYPFGSTYTLEAAQTIVNRKLSDIQMSSANVSEMDRWDKQILAILAWDDAAADKIAQAWSMADAALKADTIVVVTTTSGEDLFIYDN